MILDIRIISFSLVLKSICNPSLSKNLLHSSTSRWVVQELTFHQANFIPFLYFERINRFLLFFIASIYQQDKKNVFFRTKQCFNKIPNKLMLPNCNIRPERNKHFKNRCSSKTVKTMDSDIFSWKYIQNNRFDIDSYRIV